MKILILVALLSVGSAQDSQMLTMLGDVQRMLSTVNIRLARIEARQTTQELINTRLEENISNVVKDSGARQSEMLLWLRSTVSSLNDQKVKLVGLINGQNVIKNQLEELSNTTNHCHCSGTIATVCAPSKSTTLPSTVPSSPSSAPPSSTPTTVMSTQPEVTTTTPAIRSDCQTLSAGGALKDGVYELSVGGQLINVFCSSGYVTFQRRFDGSQRFDKTFKEYEQGFGSASGEHWLGLQYQHLMTKDKTCRFRALIGVDSQSGSNKYNCQGGYEADCDGKIKEVLAKDFRISSAAEAYRIHLVFNSTDFLNPDLKSTIPRLNGQKFSALDSDNDNWSGSSCATNGDIGGGFWYDRCMPGEPNSVHKSNAHYCSRPKVGCGRWWPYYFTSSMLQFSC